MKFSSGCVSFREFFFFAPSLMFVHRQSDFVYMVPPFLAYYGVIFQNATVLFEAYNQIKLYRSYLLDTTSNNLWRHVLLGEGPEDQGHWSTGRFHSSIRFSYRQPPTNAF